MELYLILQNFWLGLRGLNRVQLDVGPGWKTGYAIRKWLKEL